MINVPPVEVSRVALLVLVAAGAILAVGAHGDLAHFAGGFAAGAGAALVLSRIRRPTAAETPGHEEGAP